MKLKNVLVLIMWCGIIQPQEFSKQKISVHIRLATLQDIPACIALTEQVYIKIYRKIKPSTTEEYWKKTIENLNVNFDPFYRYIKQLFVAETEDKKIVGCMMAYPFTLPEKDSNELILCMEGDLHTVMQQFNSTASSIYISRLYIDEQYRNNGIGKKLLQSVFLYYPAVETIYLYTFAHNNDNTVNFYKHLGFTECFRFYEKGYEMITFFHNALKDKNNEQY